LVVSLANSQEVRIPVEGDHPFRPQGDH